MRHLSPSAHLDTFARDHLPPPEQWPDLLLDRPELHYPDRLNCGTELLDRTVALLGRDRPALRADTPATPPGPSTGPGPAAEARATAATTTWSYGELQDHVDRLAHVLTRDLGVLPGNRVLLRGPTSPQLAACWLAVMKAGGIAVTVLAAQRPHELRTVCGLARAGHALCDTRATDDLTAARIPGLRITPFGGDTPDDLLRLAENAPSAPYEAVATAADDVALIAFTSGTTGRPKGCVHFHRDVLAVADTFSAHVLRPRPDDVFAGSPPLGFTFGLGGLLLFPLRAGASSVLEQWSGTEGLLAAVGRHRVTVLFTAPTAYRAMLAKLDEPAHDRVRGFVRGSARDFAQDSAYDDTAYVIPPYDVSSLRRCVSAGENLPAATWRGWHQRTGLRLINGIGATEMLHIFLSAADEAARPGVTGVPVPGFEARVVGPEGTAPLPDGEPGLLAVRGPVGCRYLDDERQREYVREGWNLTGDTYVREPDGYFRYVARADDMIISAGYNIAGPEVEEVLLRHPDVVEAAVVGRPDEKRGQAVVAHVVLRPGAPEGETTAEALRTFTAGELTPYKCPREFVFAASLPRTPTGKLQRFRLREAHLE